MTSNRLNQTRLDKLESIGFAWSAKNLRKRPVAIVLPKPKKPSDAISRVLARQRISDSQWNEMYERLLAFKAKYGVSAISRIRWWLAALAVVVAAAAVSATFNSVPITSKLTLYWRISTLHPHPR